MVGVAPALRRNMALPFLVALLVVACTRVGETGSQVETTDEEPYTPSLLPAVPGPTETGGG